MAFLDADCVIVGLLENLLDGLSDYDFGMVHYPDQYCNDGMILLRNSPQVREFLKKLWACGPIPCPPHWPGEVEACYSTIWAELLKLKYTRLDSRFNHFANTHPPTGPVVVKAFHGEIHAAKLASIRSLVNTR